MALAALAIAASYGLMSFGISDKSAGQQEEMLTFQYTPPTTDPYSKENVEDVSNWTQLNANCPTGDDVACTIQVHIDDTVDGDGEEIDGNVVKIATLESAPDQFRVATPSATAGYANPTNSTLP